MQLFISITMICSAKATAEMQQHLIDSLTMINELSAKLLVPLWLDGGTLLGWNRQCAPIDYDHDVDVATFMSFNKVKSDYYAFTKGIMQTVN